LKRISLTDWIKKLGPGLITGAADDDPSGIATYSQAGAQFGFAMLWTVLLTYPLMVGIQIVSARIGCVTGYGLAKNIRDHYPPWILRTTVGLLLMANIINIAADVSAMGDALALVAGGPARIYAAFFGVLSALLQVFIPYRHYVFFLKWLTLSLLAYIATSFVVHVPWSEVAQQVVWPRFQWRGEYLTTVVAVFGTTISPYLFFWQASQEVEDQKADPSAQALRRDPEQADKNFRRIRLDTYIGMGFSNLVAFFIMLTTSLILFRNDVTDIQSSTEAASALRPLAGEYAFLIFSLGIIGTGLLAIPVLAGSAAYAVAEALHWRNSLELKPYRAKKFYSIIIFATLCGVLLNFVHMNPIKALYWSAVINGVISVPIMSLMMLMAVRKDIMGSLVIHKKIQILGWGAVLVMAAVVICMFYFGVG